MKKRKCQINAIQPITCFQVPIVGNTELLLTEEEIYKCLCSKAEITEILKDGTMVSLDFTNYKSIVVQEEITKEKPVEPAKEEVIEEKPVEPAKEESTEEELAKTEDLVKTHEVSSRNTNNNKQKNYNKQSKNKR